MSVCLEEGTYGVPSFLPHIDGIHVQSASFCSAADLSKKSLKKQHGHELCFFFTTGHFTQPAAQILPSPLVDTVSGRYLSAELMTDCFKSIVCAYTVRDWPCLAGMIAMWESAVGVD